MEDHVEHPMEAVFDAPMGAHRLGEETGVEGQRGKEAAAGDRRLAGPLVLHHGLDHGDGLEAREARLARAAAIGGEPVDLMADEAAADFDAAVVGVGGVVAVEGARVLAFEEEPDRLGQRRQLSFSASR